MAKRKKRLEFRAPNLTKKHYEAQSWCFKNEIYLYPIKRDHDQYSSVYENKGKRIFSSKTYDSSEISQIIWDGYLKIFLKK